MFAKTVRRLIAWWHLQIITFGHHRNHTSSCAQITFQCTRPLFLSLYSTLWPLTTTPDHPPAADHLTLKCFISCFWDKCTLDIFFPIVFYSYDVILCKGMGGWSYVLTWCQNMRTWGLIGDACSWTTCYAWIEARSINSCASQTKSQKGPKTKRVQLI